MGTHTHTGLGGERVTPPKGTDFFLLHASALPPYLSLSFPLSSSHAFSHQPIHVVYRLGWGLLTFVQSKEVFVQPFQAHDAYLESGQTGF